MYSLLSIYRPDRFCIFIAHLELGKRQTPNQTPTSSTRNLPFQRFDARLAPSKPATPPCAHSSHVLYHPSRLPRIHNCLTAQATGTLPLQRLTATRHCAIEISRRNFEAKYRGAVLVAYKNLTCNCRLDANRDRFLLSASSRATTKRIIRSGVATVAPAQHSGCQRRFVEWKQQGQSAFFSLRLPLHTTLNDLYVNTLTRFLCPTCTL